MSPLRWSVRLLLAFLALPVIALAQSSPDSIEGVPPHTVQIPVPLGFINATNGHLHLEIPIASIPERNGDPLVAKMVYDSNRYYYASSGSEIWSSTGSGWRLMIGTSHAGSASIGSSSSETCAAAGDPGYPTGNVTIASGFSFTDLNGTVHSVVNSNVYTKRYQCQTTSGVQDPNPGIPTTSGVAADGSGYTFYVTNYTNMQVYSADGTLVYDNTNDAYSLKVPVDTNGNYANTPQANSAPDTLGRTPISLSGSAYGCPITNGTTTPPAATGQISVKVSDGSTQTYTLNCTNLNVSEVFNDGAVVGTESLLTSLVLPDRTQYTFSYDTGSSPSHFGDLLNITLPTGGQVSFTYVANLVVAGGAVTSATFGGATWNLSYSFNNSTLQVITTLLAPPRYDSASNTNVSDQIIFTAAPNESPFLQSVQYYSGSSALLKTISFSYDQNFLALSMTTTLNDTGQSSQVSYQYFNGMRDHITQKQETDFSGNIIRTTVAAYNGPYLKPSSVNVYAGSNTSGTPISSTLYAYDEYSASYCKNGVPMLTNITGATNHDDANHGIGFTGRGNVTTIQRLISGTTYATSHRCYDTLGNVTQVVDANGNPTSYGYTENWADTACIPAGTLTRGFPTTVTDALGHVTRTSYFTCTSLKQSVQDPNDLAANRSGTLYTYDELSRPLCVSYPDGGSDCSSYQDTPPSFSVTETKAITSGVNLVQTKTEDGLGRVIETLRTPDPDCPSGGDRTDTTYDAFGSTQSVSNAYCTTNDSTYGITSYAYDALRRATRVTHPDNSVVVTSYVGTATQVQDEGNGTQPMTRISQKDALGRLVSVCEVSSTILIGSGGTPGPCGLVIGGTGFLTSYQYDVVNNLLQVTQPGVSARTFVYDSLSRLITATNPESGTTSYSYDPNGNLITKTDARGITTTLAYDPLNRLTQKSYSDGTTPSANFLYDIPAGWGNPTITQSNLIGRLSNTYLGAGPQAEQVFGYDAVGRVVMNNQCTPVNCGSGNFPIGYTYDLMGNMTSAGNGMNVTLTYSYPAARLTQITSSLSDWYHPTTLLSGVHYNAPGAMISATLGNGATESLGYNNRTWLQSVSASGFAGATVSSGSATLSGSEQSIPGAPAVPGTGSVTFSGTLQSKQVQTQAAAAGTGSVTFNGTLQSKQVQTRAGTSGTGTVTIEGSEQWTCPPAPLLCSGAYKIWDSGTVSITVNGFAKQASYGKTSTSSSIASALASAFNGASGSPVTASVSSNVITLTAKSTGTSTNYSLSTSVTYDNSDFSEPSFTGALSGSTLTGGTNATYGTVYDSGTSTITVNGHNNTVSWSGTGTTTSSIASALASNINADSAASVSASASGSTVNLTAKTTGASTNYSLASSWTYDSTDFSSSSFTSSNSGTALTGGANAVYNTIYDSGTSTITVNGHSDTVSWSGSGTTTSSIASALATNINADSSASATASASGSIVNLTAKTAGAATNYSLSSSSTYDSTDFGSASFSSSNSGSTLTGGHDAGATTYDSGNVWITVNGTQYAVSYGQSSTAASLASSLAQAISGTSSSPVTATASSTTVNLTSKDTGSSTNYSLSVGSSTSQSSSFSQPSFTPSASGGTMTGGGSGAPATLYSLSLGYAPDGNVTSAIDSVNGNWSYAYDPFNRLTCSNLNNGTCASPTNGQVSYTYVYDRFGNRWQQNSMTLTFTGNSPTSPNNNNRMDGYSYDAAGNLLNDGVHAYTYDAENRLTAVDGGATASYVCDANGRRVRKTAGASVDYLYDLSGHEIAEVNSSGGWNRGEIYAGGTHLATYNNNTTYFIHADWLGTERVRSNISGATCETVSSLPFGDGQVISGSCGDPSPMHFTAKRRDAESGLDNFGARYNSSIMGRFMSPDLKILSIKHVINPQKWNKYVYTTNNPLAYVDPDGLEEQSLWAKIADVFHVQGSVGVGLGVDVKVGGVKVEVEASMKSQGTLSAAGNVTTSVVREAGGSVEAFNAVSVGYKKGSETVTVKDGKPEANFKTESTDVIGFSSGHTSGSVDNHNIEVIGAGVCVLLCGGVSVGIDTQKGSVAASAIGDALLNAFKSPPPPPPPQAPPPPPPPPPPCVVGKDNQCP